MYSGGVATKSGSAKSEPERARSIDWAGSGFAFQMLGADAILVSHLPNIHYLCGFSGSAGLFAGGFGFGYAVYG